MKYLTLLLLILLLSSCLSSPEDFEKGKEQLEQQGYTEVENTGYATWCCGKEDNYKTGFKCKNKQNKVVEGCFCSSWSKGLTIRFR